MDTIDPDWPNFSCAQDLGGLLATSALIRWPPRICWAGSGDRIGGEDYERRLDDVVQQRAAAPDAAVSAARWHRCADLGDGMGAAIG